MKTIGDEIRDLTEEVHALGLRISNPRTCPRLAFDAEERRRVLLEKLADLQSKTQAAEEAP